MEDIVIDCDTLKGYLRVLKKEDDYRGYLKQSDRQDTLTSIKKYFNERIFISIKDFDEGKYDKLCPSRIVLIKYLNAHPDRRSDKKLIKGNKKYRIFLRLVSKV